MHRSFFLGEWGRKTGERGSPPFGFAGGTPVGFVDACGIQASEDCALFRAAAARRRAFRVITARRRSGNRGFQAGLFRQPPKRFFFKNAVALFGARLFRHAPYPAIITGYATAFLFFPNAFQNTCPGGEGRDMRLGRHPERWTEGDTKTRPGGRARRSLFQKGEIWGERTFLFVNCSYHLMFCIAFFTVGFVFYINN